MGRSGRSTIPARRRSPPPPAGYAGTGIVGVNGRGDMVGLYEDRGEPGVVRIVVRDRSGRFTTIPDHPGAALTEPVDITNRGEIVGFYYETDADLAAGISHGFRRSADGRYRTIDVPGALLTRPFRINDRGQIAATVDDGRGSTSGFLYERGRFTPIRPRDAVFTRPLDINDRGQVVGDYGTRPRTNPTAGPEPPGAHLGGGRHRDMEGVLP
jgi:hypothetical protein